MKRWLSIKNDKFFKYSKYAIGEILIVIIGIIVALLLHNWNEKRQDQQYFDTVLVEVEKELIKNIRTVRTSLDFYNNRDSIVNRILFDSLTEEDYGDDFEGFQLRGILSYHDPPFIRNEAFSKLMVNSQVITQEQDSLSKGLINLYTERQNMVDLYTKEVDYLMTENVRSYEKYPWYKNQFLYLSCEEATDYFLKNPIHIGQVTTYATHALNVHRSAMEQFDLDALKCYRRIYKYLANKNISSTDSLLFGYVANDYKNFVGVYKVEKYGSPLYFKTDSVEISIENDKLMYCWWGNTNRKSKREIIPASNFYFRTVACSGFYRLHYDSEGEVIGFTWSRGDRMLKHKKIR